MLRKEKSLSIRSENKRRYSKNRYSFSAIPKKRLLTIKVNSIHNNPFNRNPPPVLLTMPNNKKLTSGMGNNIEREQLYENNMQLRESLNRLRRELYESKNSVAKKDLELREKEKIIRNCIKEKDSESIHESTIKKAKESALLTMCKNKYNILKNSFEKEIEENKILKANIKITKIKEIQIENDILIKELIKIRAMYLNCKKNLKKYKNMAKDLENFKIKFLEQHSIISSYIQKCDIQNQEIINLKEEKDELLRELELNIKKQEKLKQSNDKLRIKNMKYMNQKKLRESLELLGSDKNGLLKYKKDAFEFKRAFNQKIAEYENLKQSYELNKKRINNYDSFSLKPFQYKNMKNIEQENNYKNIDKIELYKSLYNESEMKNKLYEKYLKGNNINPKDIIKQLGSGELNTGNKLLNNNLFEKKTIENSKINNENRNINKSDIKSEDISSKNTVMYTINNKKSDNNDEEEIIEKKLGNLEDTFYLFLKNFEANHITYKILEDKINLILDSFRGKEEITKENFISPFYNLFIESIKATHEKDKKAIKKFLNDYIDAFKGDRNKFFNQLNNIFQNLNDYSSLSNKEEEQLLKDLSSNLQRYKNDLENRLKQYNKNNSYIIHYDEFKSVINDLNISLNDNLMEFLLYKMKSAVPENYSIFYFSCEIIFELLNMEIVENSRNKDISKILSRDFEKLKKINLDVAFKNEVKFFHNEKDSFEVIEKDKFFEVLKINGIEFDKGNKEEIYKLFKNEEPICTNQGKIMMIDFKRLKDLVQRGIYSSRYSEEE